jgi:isopentenyl-diphosphate delta-isomerase type 1
MSVEWLDVVDEENCVTGRETRHTVHQRGLWHRGVHVFLFTSDGRLLVQRRSQAQDTYPGALDCSVSEHLRAGESYRAAAVRGLREELGLEALRLRRLVQFRMAYGPNDNMINELYEDIYDGELPAVDRREIAGIAYHTLPELEEMQAAGQIPFSSWFVQLLRWYAGRPSALQVLWSGREP